MSFVAFVRRAASPGPAGVIHVVGLGRTEHVEAAECVERLDVLRHGGRNAVLREQLADGAVLAFRRGAVVSPDVEDQGVVSRSRADRFRRRCGRPGASTCSVKPANTSISRRWKGFSSSGMRVPGGKRVRSRCELRVRAESSPAAWRAGRRARGTCPSRRRTCPYTCQPIPSGRDAGREMAPLAQYMKNGLSGSKALCLRSQPMASSARSSLRW